MVDGGALYGPSVEVRRSIPSSVGQLVGHREALSNSIEMISVPGAVYLC